MTTQPAIRRLSSAQNAVLDYLATGRGLAPGKGCFKDDRGRRIYATTLAVLAAFELLEPYETQDRRVDYRLTKSGRAYVLARYGIKDEKRADAASPSGPAPTSSGTLTQDTHELIREEAWRIAQERGDGDALGHWLEAERKIVAQGTAL